jgi:Na+-driven multidrug efflux pump
VFGVGAPLVAMVGANIGAGQSRRALRIAMVGGAFAFAATEATGLAAIWPSAWLNLFGDDPMMMATGKDYLRLVGPMYGFFGLGLALLRLAGRESSCGRFSPDSCGWSSRLAAAGSC